MAALLLVLLLVLPCAAERTVVLSATPMFKCVSCPDENCFGSPAFTAILKSPFKSDCVWLSQDQQQESRLVLVRQVESKDTLYVWESREAKPVARITNPTGIYDLYMNDTGMVKVERSGMIPLYNTIAKSAGGSGIPAGTVSYMEIVHQNLMTITYWGAAEEYDP